MSRIHKKLNLSTQKNTSEIPEQQDVFGFFQDDIPPPPKEELLQVDLTENPAYLLQLCNNGFMWNEEVLLAPSFSSSYSTSVGSTDSRTFPSLLAEKIRKHRIAQETKVIEIRLD